MSRFRKAASSVSYSSPSSPAVLSFRRAPRNGGRACSNRCFPSSATATSIPWRSGRLYEKAARGLVAELKDPTRSSTRPQATRAFNTSTGGFYAGVGMQIEPQEGMVVVEQGVPNTPAADAGILEGRIASSRRVSGRRATLAAVGNSSR